MIKTKVAFLEGRLLSSQSEQSEKLKKSWWAEKNLAFQKPLLVWSCKQAIYKFGKEDLIIYSYLLGEFYKHSNSSIRLVLLLSLLVIGVTYR